MAGIFQRMSLIFRAKTDKALDKMEDPRETLDYSYQRQLELLQKVRRGVADVATSRKRVELQANGLNTQADKLTAQAQKALEVGREDLAREALTRRSGLQQQLTDLQAQHAQLQGEEEKLTRASQRLQAKVDAFRTRKETIKATYSAAEAQTRINEAFSGISEEMGDVGMAIQRAEDKTAQMQARAGAIDELLASGVLDDPTGVAKDDITLELEALGVHLRCGERAGLDEGGLGAGPAAAAPALESQRLPGNRRADGTGSVPGSARPDQLRGPARPGLPGAARPAHRGRSAMIVRILNEGQWDLSEDAVTKLNSLDDAVEHAVSTGDQQQLGEALHTLLEEVRPAGRPVPDEALRLRPDPARCRRHPGGDSRTVDRVRRGPGPQQLIAARLAGMGRPLLTC